MTDRYKGCTVVFERSIRDDDAECIINAMRMIKGVLEVKPSIDSGEDWMNRSRVKITLRDEVQDAINKVFEEPE